MAQAKQKIMAIVGPTGSGKTALAVALARDLSLRGVPHWNDEAIPSGEGSRFELVSADSRQVYRGMDIATGKERVADVLQHLIDIVNPDEEFTLADFLDRAKNVIADIHARGHVPIVVGGTGLYAQALVENWDIPAVAPNPALRVELEKKSVDELHHELAAIDPEEAERLGLGKRYLIRALEMWRATGKKPSELKKKNEPLYDALVIGIDLPREELYARIDARVDEMFARGLVDEVQGLLKKYPPNLPAFNTIGYREVINGFGELPEEPLGAAPDRFPPLAGRRGERERGLPLEQADACSEGGSTKPFNLASEPVIKDRIKHHTHAYARHQLTWLRRMKYVVWVKQMEDALEQVRKFGV